MQHLHGAAGEDVPLHVVDIPIAEQLCYPNSATRLLEQVWRDGWHAAQYPPPVVQAVRVLRYHPGSRCALWLAMAGWPSGGCVAKVTARRDSGVGQRLLALRQAGFAGERANRVPALIAHLPALGLTLLELAPGQPVKALAGADLSAASAATARWLAALCDARLALPSAYTLRDPVSQARRWGMRVRREIPALAGAVTELWATLTVGRPSWPPVARLIHGDFNAEHVFWAPEATMVIDWDSCRPGDPVEDAGRFLASLADRAIRQHTPAEDVAVAARSFRAAYAEALPDCAARLPFYTALACLRKASHMRLRSARRAELLLKAGRAALAMDVG